MKFGIYNFKGLLPIHRSRKIPDGFATSLYDLDLKATDLRSFNVAFNLGVVADNNIIQRSGLAMSSKQIFVANAAVNMVFGPYRYIDEEDSKIYIDSGFHGYEYPVWTSKKLGIPISPLSDYLGPPVTVRKLGVPAPSVEPQLTVEQPKSGQINAVGSGTVTLEDGVTQVEEAVLMRCAAPHNLESGQRVTLAGFNWAYYNNTFVIDRVLEGTPYWEEDFILRGVVRSEVEPGVDENGDPEDPTPGTGTYTQEFTQQQWEDRVYLYTYVTEDGEEGPPSFPSDLITVGEGLAVTITTPTDPEVDDVLINTKRIYRTISTSAGAADYYFVDEIAITQAVYEDRKTHIELGELMPSLEWIMPPEGLKGLISLPNGVMMGFKGNTIYQTPPYQPHAWPDAYTKTTDFPIVGLEAFGQHVVVGTTENPYLATLSDPLTITFRKLDTVEPCVKRRSMVSFGYGVMYVSPNGLVLVTPQGATNVLKGVWDPDKWKEKINAADDIYSVVHDEKYYLTFANEASVISTTYIFDPSETPMQISALSSHQHMGACVDRDEDMLFFLGRQSGPVGPAVWIHDPPSSYGTGKISGVWNSGYYTMHMPCNMGAAQVIYEPGTFNECYIAFIADDDVKYVHLVTDSEPFRLPSGFLARDWMIEIITDSDIHGVYIAETVEELRGAGAG